ncbi:MAG: 2'-deoxycytidine 5'-triphosphate deaminase [Planctomycetota bacterium]|nr:2'-deoxycytidine 5'-triphosphate deaminase [Planctomycetota bacterium]
MTKNSEMRQPSSAAVAAPSGEILVDHQVLARLGGEIRPALGGDQILPTQVQPASLDLRLGGQAMRIRAGFLPSGGRLDGPGISIDERLQQLTTCELDLSGDGAVLERGVVYLVPLQEELDLAEDTSARFNPRSSTGRCDIFTRVLAEGHPRFDEAPAGFRGRLWLEVCPLSFPVRLRRGDRLAQVRLQQGRAALSAEELRAVHRETPLCFEGGEPVPESRLNFHDDGSIALSLGLASRDPAGWCASNYTDVVDFSCEGGHRAKEFFQPVHAEGGDCILEPGRFYIFASREDLRIPPHLAAEMLPVDPGLGELRNNYAGFFDNGFGWREDENGQPLAGGTPAVLEVRAHDMPFLVEDGQVFFRLRFFRAAGRPDALYGRGREGRSYLGQDLTLARAFHTD